MYKSPIEVFTDEMKYYYDDVIVSAVQKVDITVDKDELIRALKYDRDQYDNGYADGKLAAMRQLVRCEECVHYYTYYHQCVYHRDSIGFIKMPCDGFCSHGERKDENNG